MTGPDLKGSAPTPSSASSSSSARPVLDPVALSCGPGEFVRSLAPYTEADPAALLFNVLVIAGNSLGPDRFVSAGSVQHPGRLFVVVVGATSRARKGTARAEVMSRLDSRGRVGWRVRSLNSGEGLIEHVAGVSDGKVLVTSDEFAQTLVACGRRGSTLSAVLRQAWDGDRLDIVTRSKPVRVDRSFVSIIGEITREELLRKLVGIEMMNGFGNRFLYCWAERSQRLPEGGAPPDEVEQELRRFWWDIDGPSRRWEPLRREPDAAELWREIYFGLSDDVSGMIGAVTARAEAQMTRLQVVYASSDGSNVIAEQHVRAAQAVWNYSVATVRHVFGEEAIDRDEAKILGVVGEYGAEGCTRTQLHDRFSGHLKTEVLDRLVTRGDIHIRKSAGTGRPADRLVRAENAEEAETPGIAS